jgi:hypothetical protein
LVLVRAVKLTVPNLLNLVSSSGFAMVTSLR